MPQTRVHVKKGDTVVVVSGKDKGKKGKILEVFPNENKVVIEGVNKVKRHTKPTRQMQQGGIFEKETAINASNVMHVCKDCKEPTRLGKKETKKGKVKYCKKCGKTID